jgi:hypothetical protein
MELVITYSDQQTERPFLSNTQIHMSAKVSRKILVFFIRKCSFLNLIFTKKIIIQHFVPDISLTREGTSLNPRVDLPV